MPPTEIEVILGARQLNVLTGTVNEAWNKSIPVVGPRPQPDYVAGFKRDGFTRAQLDRLRPFVRTSGQQSFVCCEGHNVFSVSD